MPTRMRSQREALPKAFGEAKGDHEVHIDAGKVNTPEGWRDGKVGVYAVRERGEPACSEDCEPRDLPTPTVRSVIAVVEELGAFAQRCRTESDRVGLTNDARLSVSGDGAEWVWNLAGEQFVGSPQVLDDSHAVEYLGKASQASLGADEFPGWLDRAKGPLLGDGYVGACEALGRRRSVRR